jgi:Ca2+-binding RTX toxin-like protein
VENVLFNSGSDTFIRLHQAGVNSSVEGGWGNDSLTGGAGNDVLYGDKKDNSTSADSSITYNDTLDGGAGDDSLFGGLGDDSLNPARARMCLMAGTASMMCFLMPVSAWVLVRFWA